MAQSAKFNDKPSESNAHPPLPFTPDRLMLPNDFMLGFENRRVVK
jgi:hypothetical protein